MAWRDFCVRRDWLHTLDISLEGEHMKVGDLIRVKLPSITPFIGLALKTNDRGGALVRSIDGKYQYWVNSWSSEVISEGR